MVHITFGGYKAARGVFDIHASSYATYRKDDRKRKVKPFFSLAAPMLIQGPFGGPQAQMISSKAIRAKFQERVQTLHKSQDRRRFSLHAIGGYPELQTKGVVQESQGSPVFTNPWSSSNATPAAHSPPLNLPSSEELPKLPSLQHPVLAPAPLRPPCAVHSLPFNLLSSDELPASPPLEQPELSPAGLQPPNAAHSLPFNQLSSDELPASPPLAQAAPAPAALRPPNYNGPKIETSGNPPSPSISRLSVSDPSLSAESLSVPGIATPPPLPIIPESDLDVELHRPSDALPDRTPTAVTLTTRRHERPAMRTAAPTVWFESCSARPIVSPSITLTASPGDLYLHFHHGGHHVWLMRDAVWTDAVEGHAHPSNGLFTLRVTSSGQPMWIKRHTFRLLQDPESSSC
ncbi:hypothetical protein DFP72DRAFT_1074017 [Ephemerocybe angulata]|uniref:Uncharacterized protein n=1 Tax=Ephemerocybe angulata TaxID=980116 RepID=A0A8H6HKF2_9AGAR|nr:hypothetical protein DFP72DRAFT_1074017 [Tulosesus angulatus]